MDAKTAIAIAEKKISEAGFGDKRTISAEEFEDGVGAGVGVNYVRVEDYIPVFYTEAQAMREIGIEIFAQGKKKSQSFCAPSAARKFARFLDQNNGNADWTVRNTQ